MATVTPGKTFTSNEVVTPANLNLLGVPTVSNIVTADLADFSVTTAKIANGAVTQEKLNSSVTLVPTGAIMPFARATAPSGWLIANGDTVPNATGTVQSVTTDFTALYAAVGSSFGALGKLPDLRGIFVRGSGTQLIGSTTYNKAFASKESDAVGPHTHSGTTGNDSPDHTHNYSVDSGTAQGYGGGGATINALTTAATTGASTRHTHTFTTTSQAPASTVETRPANIALLYCIKI